MKTMQDYTIYCTEEQTRRAYKLGAPLVLYGKFDDSTPNVIVTNQYGTEFKADLPTTQQMVNWLREKRLMFLPLYYGKRYAIRIFVEYTCIYTTNIFPAYEQAEHAAIDAALDYLEKGGKA